MKKYVFITPSLSNMGGAQMYIRNKLLYLINAGWKVDVIAGKADNVLINELKCYKEVYPELLFDKYLFLHHVQYKLLNTLKNRVEDSNYEEIVIESSTIQTSLWAESLAKSIKAKHLVYLLTESNETFNSGLRDFFIFKHRRRELVGINIHSLVNFLKPFYPIEAEESYHLRAICNNVEADVDHPLLHQINKNDYDFIIGGVSRMDKPFVFNAVSDICEFSRSCSNKKFLLLWLGDASCENSIISITNLTKAQKNVSFIKTGYILPVPTKLLEICDVLISSSGSSWPCLRSGVPTITYDANDCKPIGILGRTTNNSLFRNEEEPPIELSNLLEQVLIKKSYKRVPSSYNTDLPDFSEHLVFLSKMEKEQKYFDVDSIRTELYGERKISFGLTLFGPKGYIYIHNIINRI